MAKDSVPPEDPAVVWSRCRYRVLPRPHGPLRSRWGRREDHWTSAAHAAVTVTELNSLLNKFGQMQQMFKKMGKLQKMMAKMGGGAVPGMR